MRFAKRIIIRAVLHDECRFTFFAQKTGRDRHRPAGVNDMDDRLTIMWRNFDGGVRAAGGCSADQQRQLETLPFHLTRHVNHLVKRRSNQPAEPDKSALSDFARSRIFSHGTITPMSMTS